MFRAMDRDGDGHVTFSELLRIVYPFATEAEHAQMLRWRTPDAPAEVVRQLSAEQEDEIRRIFALYDCDHSGGLSSEELTNVMQGWATGADVRSVFDEVDANHDGIITLEEFRTFMVKSGVY